jgi:hypothetical protein
MLSHGVSLALPADAWPVALLLLQETDSLASAAAVDPQWWATLLIATAAGVLLLGTAAAFYRMYQELNRGDSPRLEHHWGGLGGGLGGWRVSPSLAYLLLTVALASLLTLIVTRGADRLDRLAEQRARTATLAGETDATAAARDTASTPPGVRAEGDPGAARPDSAGAPDPEADSVTDGG